MIESERLVIPEGKVTGCLPRKSRYGECCALLSDKMDIIPRDQWAPFIGVVSLRPRVHVVFDQNGVGSCAAESATSALMIGRDVAGLPFTLMNSWTIYHFTSGGRDNGSSIDENLEFLRDNGVLPESYWPRSKGWRADPPSGWKDVAKRNRVKEFFDVGSTAEVGTALIRGYAVVFGWQGHSCILTALLSETKAEYLNSWDETWGDHGFGQIRLDAINFGYGAWAVRTVEIPPDEIVVPTPIVTP